MAEITATTLAAVEFHGATLVTTLVDGVPHVALRPVCEAIGLDWNGQYQRIGRDPVLSSTVVVTTTVAEDGKRREMVALPLKHLNGWLFGVDANRVAPDVQDRLIEYQRECYDVLADYWQKGSATNPRASAASLMIGQSTGLPTTQLVALQTQGWKIIDRLKAESVRELRADLYQQLVRIYSDMAMTAPPLDAIGQEAPDAAAEVVEFWTVFKALERLGHPVNHSRNPELVALKLDQVATLAQQEGLDVAPAKTLKRLLRASRSPRFVDVKSINSAHAGVTVHCWVFRAQEGGAA